MIDPNQPPQQPQQPGDSITIEKFVGLKNTVTRERLKPTEQEIARNVDIDDADQVHRRRGYTLASAGNYHSLYSTGSSPVYGVKNGTLGIIYANYTFEALLPGVGDEYLSYVQIADDLYFSSASASGVINTRSHIVSQWGAEVSAGTWLSPVVNPTETLGPVRGKILGKPPMATALAYWNGRIYMANKRTVWATELYLYHHVDKTKNYLQFEDPVTLLAAVTDGFYVGTESAVYFMSGSFKEMKRVPVMSVGALPRSAVVVPAELVKPQLQQDQNTPAKNAVMFMTTTGLCAGFDSGLIYNLTQADVLFPDAVSVAPLFRRQDGVNQYIGVADNAGTPSANTRIGDYVDAEIRRFQGA